MSETYLGFCQIAIMKLSAVKYFYKNCLSKMFDKILNAPLNISVDARPKLKVHKIPLFWFNLGFLAIVNKFLFKFFNVSRFCLGFLIFLFFFCNKHLYIKP